MRCRGENKISRQSFVCDHTTGIHFLVDSGTQISIIPATEVDKKKGLHKFTLQAVNKSLIKTYGQRYLTLNLDLRRAFIRNFVIVGVEKAILGAEFLHKYGLVVDITRRCLVDLVMNIKSFGSVR